MIVQIFREPRQSGQVDQVLADYASAIDRAKKNPGVKPNGALLFSVVGKTQCQIQFRIFVLYRSTQNSDRGICKKCIYK